MLQLGLGPPAIVDELLSVADLEGVEPAPPHSSPNWATDWRRHCTVLLIRDKRYCIMATPSPVYLLKHVNMVLRIFTLIATSGFLAA